MATARTSSAFRLCLAASAIPVAVSAMSAATASGGVPPGAVATTPAAGVWATTTRTRTTTTTSIRASCSVFVV